MAMKPLAPKPLTPKSKYKFSKPAKPAPGSGNDPVSKALKFFLGDQTKPSGKKNMAPKSRAVRPRNGKPAPMPTRVPNLSLPPDQRAKAKPMPSGPKKKSPGVVIKPRAKKKY